MKDRDHCTSEMRPETSEKGEIVSLYVAHNHPLLQLKGVLPWERLFEVMSRHWREAGKNVDGRPGLSWDVSLYVPLLVLKLVKRLNSRDMEDYLKENVVARVFIGCPDNPWPQIRDHSNIHRAYASLGQEGLEEVTALILHVARDYGFCDIDILSSDTTAQELPIGYPNEPGILRGIAQRCGRALQKLKARGVLGLEDAVEQVEVILRSVKEHHLFAKGKEDKQQLLARLLSEVDQLMNQTGTLAAALSRCRERVTQSAVSTLVSMQEVAKRLMPQIVQWMSTGVVARGKILHAGITQAGSIVRNKAGKKVEFGLPYLLSRLGGGYIFGTMIRGKLDETKMPLEALKGYRAIFGQEATPELMVYDRGGGVNRTMDRLEKEGVKQVGVQPKGKAAWRVAGAVRDQVRSERGKTEGIIGTLKSNAYKF
ncbi:MAG: hypothetical protein ACE1Z4_00590, partial [Gammaproteobacteria bacterium]